MNCKKLNDKCNSKSCPYLQHLLVARRFDNWEAMFSECPNLIEDTKHSDEDSFEDELDNPIEDEIIEGEEMEAT